jgi:hypothetical protein
MWDGSFFRRPTLDTWLPAIIIALIHTTPKIIAEIRKFRDDRRRDD